MEKKIVVLMSTYNGEKYVREQLDSIIAQKDVDLTLIVRDDGSSDGTPEILSGFARDHDNVIFVNENNKCNLGFNGSFLSLIEYGLKNTDATYFSFADQDDYWIPSKLSSALDLIGETLSAHNCDEQTPLYYYANKYWSDVNLKPIHEDNMRYCKDDYFDMCMLPPVYGCASVFNRRLAEVMMEKEIPESILYDVYMFRLACMMGGLLISDKRPQLYYRRHGNNASGDSMTLSPLKHIKKYLHEGNSFHGIRDYVDLLDRNYGEYFSAEPKKLAYLIENYEKSAKCRVKLFFWPKAYNRGLKAAVVWMGRVILKAI